MVFSGMTFLYFFLPATFVLYFLCSNRVYRNTILLIASLVFYSWGEPKNIALMLLASFIAYISGLLMDKLKNGARRAVLIVSVGLLVGNLFIFKYLNFTVSTIETVLKTQLNVPQILLPIGISFYTFQILSYVIDLYRGKVKVQRNYFYLTLYVAFFPQLIAGPIVRYETVEYEIKQRRESVTDVAQGMRRFIIGLCKKVIIANNVANIPLIVYSGDSAVFGSGMYFLAAIGYALQIYFDFSGYSDMAIGLGRVFGFHFLENFNYPYVANSITDFWRRWHISLSTWFKDYIYIPLGGNRVKKPRFIFNILVVWTLTGFWHGANWIFILWGFYYGVLLLLEKLVWGKFLTKLPKALRWVYSMFFVLIGWTIFNSADMAELWTRLKIMFAFIPTDIMGVVGYNSDILQSIMFVPLGIICMLPWKNKIKLPENLAVKACNYVVCVFLFVLCIIYILSSTYNPFIYFRF